MFTLRFGPLTRESSTVLRLLLALGVGGVLVGPAFAALATSRYPSELDRAREIRLTLASLRVKVLGAVDAGRSPAHEDLRFMCAPGGISPE